ncbi:deoxyribodipyrimidine photo-lyase [Vibrio penaeicida]|uniref:deoxyribodipyrimidine photo-lyase n=1 Tax=Vibrio penaeicida TaxID=104609 RepID=UPI00351F102C
MKHKTLYWFTHDLRLQDNDLLQLALHTSEQITFIYIFDEHLGNCVQFNSRKNGKESGQTSFTVQKNVRVNVGKLKTDYESVLRCVNTNSLFD